MTPIPGKSSQVVPYSPSNSQSSREPRKSEFDSATRDIKINLKPTIFERLAASLSTFARKFASAPAKPAALSVAAAPAQPSRPSPARSASPSSGPGEPPTVDEILSIMQKENDRNNSEPRFASFARSAEGPGQSSAASGQKTAADKAPAQEADRDENARMMRAMRGRSS